MSGLRATHCTLAGCGGLTTDRTCPNGFSVTCESTEPDANWYPVERDPFADDVCARLVKSEQEYQRHHGHYIVPLAQRLLDTRAELAALRAEVARLRDALTRADKTASKAHDAMWAMDFEKTSAGRVERWTWTNLRKVASDHIHKLHEVARAALAGSAAEEGT